MLSHVKATWNKLSVDRMLLIGLFTVALVGGALSITRVFSTSSAASTTRPPTANTIQETRSVARLESELVTITPTGFEPRDITRPQGPFILAVDNRSGLEEVDLFLEQVTGTRLNVSLTRKRKLAWRERIDLPLGTYVLKAANDASWRCRITIISR